MDVDEVRAPAVRRSVRLGRSEASRWHRVSQDFDACMTDPPRAVKFITRSTKINADRATDAIARPATAAPPWKKAQRADSVRLHRLPACPEGKATPCSP